MAITSSTRKRYPGLCTCWGTTRLRPRSPRCSLKWPGSVRATPRLNCSVRGVLSMSSLRSGTCSPSSARRSTRSTSRRRRRMSRASPLIGLMTRTPWGSFGTSSHTPSAQSCIAPCQTSGGQAWRARSAGPFWSSCCPFCGSRASRTPCTSAPSSAATPSASLHRWRRSRFSPRVPLCPICSRATLWPRKARATWRSAVPLAPTSSTSQWACPSLGCSTASSRVARTSRSAPKVWASQSWC
mmetsp:Transcript_14311/g.45015  ORF Transcript_14311/g.45015 Transcript_14311/m.45015 type:complete len:241 (-) Transcript_14311:380-1102(-)